MTPTKDQKGEHFCESFQDVFDVVFGNKQLSCSNGLKFSWVFEVLITSLVPLLVDFKAIDSTTRLDRSALHCAVLGGGVVKYLARFDATTASSRSPATTIRPTPPPTSTSTRPNRALTRAVALSQDNSKPSLHHSAAVSATSTSPASSERASRTCRPSATAGVARPSTSPS